MAEMMPEIRPAGVGELAQNSTLRFNESNLVVKCVQPETYDTNERPTEIVDGTLKYRKMYQHQPGLRFKHEGLVDVPLPPAHHRYGISTAASKHVVDCMTYAPKTDLEEHLIAHKEKDYWSRKKEPLGRGMRRGFKMPEKYEQPDFRHGVATSFSESSKNLIYLPDEDGAAGGAPNERDVTRPTNRQYSWEKTGIDPASFRFGRVSNRSVNTITSSHGVADCLSYDTETNIASKRVQAMKNFKGNPLGRTRNPKGNLRTFPKEKVFGYVDAGDEYGVKETIQGAYSEAEQMPDRDLGVSVLKLKKEYELPDKHKDRPRGFGTPSIRDDIIPPTLRSVADPQNYGNEDTGKNLLYPEPFAFAGVHSEDFEQPRSKNEIRALFRAIGHEFKDDEFLELTRTCMQEYGALSVVSFRNVLNRKQLGITHRYQ